MMRRASALQEEEEQVHGGGKREIANADGDSRHGEECE